MKKIILSTAVAALMLGIAGQASAIDSTGCGLGSMAWRGQRGILPQILAVTTNGTSANQTFGITSGTSGCDPNGAVTGGTQRMFGFLKDNMEQYAMDASRGEGQTIAALADIAGVSYDEMARISKDNFAKLFPDENVTAVDVALTLDALLKA